MSVPRPGTPPADAPVLWRGDAEGLKRPKSDKPGEILKLLSRSRRHATLYGADHPVVMDVLRELHELLKAPLSTRPFIRVFVRDDTFFVENNVLLEESLKYDALLTAFKEREITLVRLDARVEPAELAHLTGLLNMKAEELRDLGGPVAYLKEHGVQHIAIESIPDGKAKINISLPGGQAAAGGQAGPSGHTRAGGHGSPSGPSGAGVTVGQERQASATAPEGAVAPGPEAREEDGPPADDPLLAMLGDMLPTKVNPQAAYRSGLRVMDELTYEVSQSAPPNLWKAEKVVGHFLDILTEQGAAQLGVAALKRHDEDSFHHSVNVCILSLMIGSRLDLDRPLLAVLGVAALLHDIGKSRVPQDLLTKPAKLTPEEEEVVRRHTLYGAHALRDFPDLLKLAMVVAFEHHANYNLSGYPPITLKKVPHVLTRIVQVADVFDAATSSRRGYREPKRAAEVLRILLTSAGTLFDPVVARVAVGVLIDVYRENPTPETVPLPD